MGHSEIKKSRVIKKQIQSLEKKERKVLNRKQFKFVKDKMQPIQEKLEDKIPKGLQLTLENAFATSFKLVFEKGIDVIEKSYNKEEKNIQFDIQHYAVLKKVTHKNIKNIDKTAQKSMIINQVITTVEGSALGFLGIGLPDIPILIGMILKNIYEISLSYGFDYTKERERIYILYLICASVTKEQAQANYSKLLDEVISNKSSIEAASYNLEVIIKETAHRLAEAMLVAKFIQGLPIVGIVGGLSNYTIMKDINNMAKIKYKKRYLEKLI